MVGPSDTDGIKAGCDFGRNVPSLGNDDRQRPGEKCLHQPDGAHRYPPGNHFNHRHVRDMNDQWVVGWAAFGAENFPDSLRIQCIRAQPENRFGRECHHPAIAEESSGDTNRGGYPGMIPVAHEARLTIQPENPSRNFRNPSRCSGGKLYFAGASASTTRKHRSHSCRSAS